MAPELLLPDKFGFTGKLAKQLPSKDTDIYAIGMTILEVNTRPFLLKMLNSFLVGTNGVSTVRRRKIGSDGYAQSHERSSTKQTILGVLRYIVGAVGGNVGCATCSRTSETATRLHRTRPTEGMC